MAVDSSVVVVVNISDDEGEQKDKSNKECTDKNIGIHMEGANKQPKRNNSPGIRVVGGRIYDSKNGKTCHQCRQKSWEFGASCKRMKGAKQYTIKYCHKCLLNRYGEKAEEKDALSDWNCPKCRDICNCSFCMKKKGLKPTGVLTHTQMELLLKNKNDFPENSTTLFKVSAIVSPKKQETQNSVDGIYNTNLNSSSPREDRVIELDMVENIKNNVVHTPKKGTEEIALIRSPGKIDIPQKNISDYKDNVRRSPKEFNAPQEVTITDENTAKKCEEEAKKVKKAKVEREPKMKSCKILKDTDIDYIAVDVVLPQGNMLTNLLGINLLPHEAGYVLQFLEFCSAFGEVLNIREGQPESVLRDVLNSRTMQNGKFTSDIEFIIQLVSFIFKDNDQENKEEESFCFDSLKRCFAKSNLELEDFPEDCLDKGSDGYEMLESSQKLRLLTFLCDESLSTKKMRTWIDEQILKFVERDKEKRGSLNAAKEKVKQKVKEEVAKLVGPTSYWFEAFELGHRKKVFGAFEMGQRKYLDNFVLNCK